MAKGQREGDRVGAGEYQPVADNWVARIWFLNAISCFAPHVYDEMIAIGMGVSENDSPDDTERPVPNAIANWAVRRQISYPWVLSAAVGTLRTIAAMPELRCRRGWHSVPITVRWEPHFPIEGWNPVKERETQFRGRIEAHIAAVRIQMESLGYQTTPEKRNVEKHVEWLVRYQVEGWSWDQILAADDRLQDADVSTIRKAVTAAARLVGIKLRT
jgi:hypothetical protein